MKKISLIPFAAVAASALILCSCSLQKNTGTGSENFSTSSTAAVSPTSEPADSVMSSSSSLASESVPVQSSASKEEQTASKQQEQTDYTATAKKLLEALKIVDKMGATGLSTDEKATIKKDNREYVKVTDSRFKNTESVRKYITDSMTEKMISSRYSGILGTESPKYIDNDGALYQLFRPISGGFAFSDEDPQISDVGVSGFTITAKYDEFGATATMTIKVVSENGMWKIDSINM